MRSVFVDTSAFVALRNEAEAEHEGARAALAKLISERAALFTSNYVFAETYTALLVRVGREEAIEWGRRFRAGGAIELVRLEPDVEAAAWEILERHDDKRWSYVDATSFALIERDGGGEAFAFDSHFAQRGLRVLPGPDGKGESTRAGRS
jgi:predicted nucleic acid-binding protein